MKDIYEILLNAKQYFYERLDAKEALKRAIGNIKMRLEELSGEELTEFGLGAKSAFIECLEFLWQWKLKSTGFILI